jgi:hypothetical protein
MIAPGHQVKSLHTGWIGNVFASIALTSQAPFALLATRKYLLDYIAKITMARVLNNLILSSSIPDLQWGQDDCNQDPLGPNSARLYDRPRDHLGCDPVDGMAARLSALHSVLR